VDLQTAIQDSVDTFFYNLGAQMNVDPLTHPQGGALQQWASKFGIGHATGIDLPGEASGSMASPATFKALYKLQLECEHHTGSYAGKPTPAGGCQIADTGDWYIGDNVNAAVGQGDVQVTPLQLAVVYSAIANGGKIVTPHVAMQIQSHDGTIVQNINPPAKRRLNIEPAYLTAIQEGLRQAVEAGTSADVMGSFPQEVYGKTGTAQYFNAQGVETDYAWYACYVPRTATTKPITVVVWVPKGGFGDVAAAPVARQILNQWFYGKRGKFIEGTEKTL
jgi:penicillin-binding protein 2